MMFLPTAIVSPTLDEYKIVDIARVSTFAGKMGREVRETWKVTRGSDEFTVIVMPYHTNVANTTVRSVGDTVNIHSRARGKVIRVTLREVTN